MRGSCTLRRLFGLVVLLIASSWATAEVSVTGKSVWPRRACEGVEGVHPELRRLLRTWRLPVAPRDPAIDPEGREVVLRLDVAASGEVSWANPIYGDPILARAAAEAVGAWVFEPITRLDGAPAPFAITVTVCFDLAELPAGLSRSNAVTADLVKRLGAGPDLLPEPGTVAWALGLRDAWHEAHGTRAEDSASILRAHDRLLSYQRGCPSCRTDAYASMRSRLEHDFATMNLLFRKEAAEAERPTGGWLLAETCRDSRAELDGQPKAAVDWVPSFLERRGDELARCPDREDLWQVLAGRVENVAQIKGRDRDPDVRRIIEQLLQEDPPATIAPRLLLVLADHLADVDPLDSAALERRALSLPEFSTLPNHDWNRRLRAAEARGDFTTALYIFILDGMKPAAGCGMPDGGPGREFQESYYKLRLGIAPTDEWIRLRGLTPSMERIFEDDFFPFDAYLERLVAASRVVGREQELADWILEVRQHYVGFGLSTPDRERIKEELWRYVQELEPAAPVGVPGIPPAGRWD